MISTIPDHISLILSTIPILPIMEGLRRRYLIASAKIRVAPVDHSTIRGILQCLSDTTLIDPIHGSAHITTNDGADDGTSDYRRRPTIALSDI